MSAEAWRRSRTDVAPRSFAWQAWHFRHLRLDLRGRRGTFCTTIDVSGSLATKYRTDVAPRSFAWQAWHFRYLRLDLRGRRGTFCWYFLYHHRCQRKLGDEVGLMWRRGLLRGRCGTFGTPGAICVAGVVLSVPP